MKRRILLASAIVAFAFPAVPAHAQQPHPLERVEAAMLAGRFTEARALLRSWRESNPQGSAGAIGDAGARALLLEGVLAPDFATAEDLFLEIVLAHPSSSSSPEALLRLGQGLHALEDHARAAAYLERLVADYPGTQQRAVGMLWLARTHTARGQRVQACAVLRRIDTASDDASLQSLAVAERAQACDGAAAPATVATQPPPAPAPASQADVNASRSAAAASLRYAVQSGAFRSRASAENLARQLTAAGFDARIVNVTANDLVRVRVGRFATSRDAAAVAGRITARGFPAIIVNDAPMER